MEQIIIPPPLPKKDKGKKKETSKEVKSEPVIEKEKKSEEPEIETPEVEVEPEIEPEIEQEEVIVDNKGEGTEKVKVNFMDDGFMKDYVKKPTKESEAETDDEKTSGNGGKKDPPDNKDTKVPNDDEEKKFGREELQDFAEVFIDVLDMLLSTALRFYAKDKSSSEYELEVRKKERLSRQLTNLFLKYQTKLSLEFMFCVTLIICYSVPFSKAKKHRKLVNANGGVAPKKEPGQPRKK